MLDNPFLPEKIRRKILSYEPTEENIRNGTADNYMWEVYGLGNPAHLAGLIYSNWDIVQSIPEGAKLLGCGLDYGFTNDPTALIEIYKYENELYFNELIYETGLTNPDIDKKMLTLGISKSLDIVGDSAEPKSNEELRRYGWNIRGATKGQDSVNYGIDILKSYKCHVTRRSIHLDRERRKYKWAEDKNGKTLNKPIDAFNHGMDGVRYLAMNKLAKKQDVKIYNFGIIG
jgi:phage terminase large subunit